MQTASEILSFYFPPDRFKQSAERAFTPALKQKFENRINRLKGLKKDVDEKGWIPPKPADIKSVFLKFKNAYKQNLLTTDSFNKRELKTLVYALSHTEQGLSPILSNTDELDAVIALLQANWKDSFIIGLTKCLMDNWEFSNQKSIENLRLFVTEKLKIYNGNRTAIKNLKSNLRFLEKGNLKPFSWYCLFAGILVTLFLG